MFSSEEREYYSRQLSLPELGSERQQLLKQAHVLVVGAGGLGCPALLYLAAAGVGKLGIVDFDRIEISNLHRQVLFAVEDVGKLKAEVAAQKLQKLNPFIEVQPYNEPLTTENVLRIMADYDLVMDGSDNFPTRYLVNDACLLLNIPWVFGAIFKFEGQVSVFNFQEGPTYRCLHPDPPGINEVPNCEEAGVLGVLPGIIGTLMASEAIRLVAGLGEIASGKMIVFDALSSSFVNFKFDADQAARTRKGLRGDYGGICSGVLYSGGSGLDEAGPEEVTFSQLTELMEGGSPPLLVDVRDPEEHRRSNIGGVNFPLRTLAFHLPELAAQSSLVFYCQSGKRSKMAAEIVQKELEIGKIKHLKGGLNSVTG